MSIKSLHSGIDRLQKSNYCLTANSYQISNVIGHFGFNRLFYIEEPPDHYRKPIDYDAIECPQIFRVYRWDDINGS